MEEIDAPSNGTNEKSGLLLTFDVFRDYELGGTADPIRIHFS